MSMNTQVVGVKEEQVKTKVVPAMPRQGQSQSAVTQLPKAQVLGQLSDSTTSEVKSDKPVIDQSAVVLTSQPVKTRPLSAAAKIREMITASEPIMTEAQKNKLFDREFISKHCGISMELFIPTGDDNKRYINGRPRYMKKPITFMNQTWYITNDVHKGSVDRFNKLIEYFKTTGDINPPEPVRKNMKS